MIKENGLGLAANQVGLDMQLFLIGNPEVPDTIIPIFNPAIMERSHEQVLMKEGCLTWPGMTMKIKRSTWISARFQNLDGKFQTQKFMGITARCFQHEFDHLNGVVFFSKVSRYHLAQARNQLNRDNRRNKRNERNKIIRF